MEERLKSVSVNGLDLWYSVAELGQSVASNIVGLVELYAARAALHEIPPITLEGDGWNNSWEALYRLEGCTGNSGPSKDELRAGSEDYSCLRITAPKGENRKYLHPTTIEATIAHEVVHLRWKRLKHGPEFFARVSALITGATFSKNGRWNKKTREIMEQCREQTRNWYLS